MDNWNTIIVSASSETRDIIDSISKVLKDMGIDVTKYDSGDNVDLFIRFQYRKNVVNDG